MDGRKYLIDDGTVNLIIKLIGVNARTQKERLEKADLSWQLMEELNRKAFYECWGDERPADEKA